MIGDQTGRTALVTGANTGLGYQTALGLATVGASVVLGVRTLAKGERAAAAIRAEVGPAASVRVAELDLADLGSVRRFAERWTGPLHVLVANAGVMLVPRLEVTGDGFERQMGTNHLGHFALVGRLLPALREAAADIGPAPRVVSLSSMAHLQAGRLDRGWGLVGRYVPMTRYAQSKLATAMFALEFDRRLRAAGERIVSVAAHPGWSATDQMTRRYDDRPKLGVLVSRKVSALLGSAPARGAQSQLLAATSIDVVGGSYLGPRFLIRGRPRPAGFSAAARRADDARWLWSDSTEFTEVEYLNQGG